MKYCLDIFFNYNNSVSGQLPLRKISPPSRTIASWMIVPGQLPPRKIPPPAGTIAPKKIAPWMVAPGFLVPNSYLKDSAPDNIPWKLPPGKTAF